MTAWLKSTAIAAIERERQHWNEIVLAVGDRADGPLITETWTFKEIAGHLLGWREQSVREFEAEARGEEPPSPPWPAELTEDDEINAWIDEHQRGRAAAEILADYDRGFDRLIAVINGLGDDELSDPNRFPSLEGSSLLDLLERGDYFGHFKEDHEPDVRRWLEQHGSQAG